MSSSSAFSGTRPRRVTTSCAGRSPPAKGPKGAARRAGALRLAIAPSSRGSPDARTDPLGRMLKSQENRTPTRGATGMNAIFAQDVMDHRHAALVAEAEQSRRYQAARAAAAATRTRPRAPGGPGPGQPRRSQAARAAAAATRTRPTPRIRAVRRPFAAVHAWLVAGVL